MFLFTENIYKYIYYNNTNSLNTFSIKFFLSAHYSHHKSIGENISHSFTILYVHRTVNIN